MNLVERLEKTKANLGYAGWAQGTIASRKFRGSLCLSEAVNKTELAERYRKGDGGMWDAHIALCNVLGLDAADPMTSIIDWNDARHRTRDDVMAALDRAIEVARGSNDRGQQQQADREPGHHEGDGAGVA
jgi:hypothetical protein